MLIDVLIIGAGPAGCATALSLFKSKPDATFAIIDDSTPNAFKIGESLPPEAVRTLRYLSPALSELISEPPHLKCTGNASIWDSPEIHEQFGMMNPFGLGWHLDRALFEQSLRDAVSATGKNVFMKGKFTKVTNEGGLWVVSVTDLSSSEEKMYRANWLIDATGRKASVAHQLGAKTVRSDDLLAFYVVFRAGDPLTPDLDNRTLIEATPPGWFYSAQLPRQRRIVMFHTSGSSSAAKVARRLPGFMDILNEHSTFIRSVIEDQNYYAEDDEVNQWPRATAAGSSRLMPFGSQEERWVAVGDAAMAFDPLSSQGIITALKSGCMLGMSLAEETVNLEPLGMAYESILEDYVIHRRWFYKQAMFDEEFWRKQR